MADHRRTIRRRTLHLAVSRAQSFRAQPSNREFEPLHPSFATYGGRLSLPEELQLHLRADPHAERRFSRVDESHELEMLNLSRFVEYVGIT